MTHKPRYLAVLLAAMILSFAVRPVVAADPQPKTMDLTLTPAAPPTPALKYRLLPAVLDTVQQDAAPLYLLAAGSWPQNENNAGEKELTPEQVAEMKLPANETHTWASVLLEAPLEQVTDDRVRPLLADIARVYHTMELASRCDRCNWGLPIREQGFATLLPYLQTMRSVTNAIAIKARWHVSKKQWPEALEALRINMALVRNLDRDAVLIQQLVAVAIGSRTLYVLGEAAGQDGAPNLYNALAALPRPMLDRVASLETERAAVYWTLPELRRVKDGEFTAADWGTINRRLASVLEPMEKDDAGKTITGQLKNLGAAVLLYPTARQYLIDRGTPVEQVDKMDKGMVLGRYVVESSEEIWDEMAKWSSLPYWIARPKLRELEGNLGKMQKNAGYNPLIHTIPAMSRAGAALVKFERLIAVHMAIEAIRAYAAAHDGKLPAKLEDIEATPTLVDPMTGKQFVYKVEGGTATIESLDTEQPQDGLIVKLKMK